MTSILFFFLHLDHRDMKSSISFTESNPLYETSHQDKIEFMTALANGHKRRTWSLVSSSKLHEPHIVDRIWTSLDFNETDDGILLNFALQIKHRILVGITLHQSNGSSQTTWLALSIRSCNNLTENWLSIIKSETQQLSVDFQCTISLGSMLRFFNQCLILVIFFQTPVLDLLAKVDSSLSSNPWIYHITFAQSAEF